MATFVNGQFLTADQLNALSDIADSAIQPTGGALTGALNNAPTVTLASAGSVAIGAASANSVLITGTVTITAFDNIAAGAERLVVFSGALLLTQNATSLILPTAANITTAAGDAAQFLSLGSGNWRCVSYTRASGSPLAGYATANLVDYNNATTFDAFGDSITYGVGASVPANDYANRLASARGLAITNHAVSGDMVADQASPVFALSVAIGQQSTLMIGTNDQRTYQTSTFKQSCFKRGHMALVAWLAIPDGLKVKGSAGSFTGTWSAAPVFATGLMQRSNSIGSTATYSVYGRVIYLATVLQNSNNSTFSVAIDGVNKGTFSCQPGGGVAITSVNGVTYMPGLLRFPGLSEGQHSVVVTVLTSVSSAYTYVAWVAGNGGASTKDGPNVFVGNVPRFTSSGYSVNGGSDATVTIFNDMIRQNIRTLSGDGLQVTLADTCPLINVSTMLVSDGVHPNDTGHATICASFLEAMNQIGKPAFAHRSFGQQVQINQQTGTSYQITMADAATEIRMSNASASTLTVPTFDEVPYEVGEIIPVRQAGAGQVTVTAASGVTINTAGTLLARTQYSALALHNIAPNVWDLAGDSA